MLRLFLKTAAEDPVVARERKLNNRILTTSLNSVYVRLTSVYSSSRTFKVAGRSDYGNGQLNRAVPIFHPLSFFIFNLPIY